MFYLLSLWWQKVRRNNEANKLGWSSVGRMLTYGRGWSEKQWRREIRRSNRLYRLAHGKSPWRPVNGF